MASVKKRKWTHNGVEKSAWVVRWQEGGKHRSKQFEKKKDADAHRLQVETLIASGSELVDSQITVGEVVEQFLRHEEFRLKDGRISTTTHVGTKFMVDKYIKPLLGKIRMASLTQRHVDRFYEDMVRLGLKPSVAKDRVRKLGAICKFAIRQGYARENVAQEAKKELKGVAQEPIRTMTQAEMQRILKWLEDRPHGHPERSWRAIRCFVHLGAFCGLRAGEMRGLTLENIDFDNGLLRVRHNLTMFDELKGPKTKAGVRDVPLPAHIAEMLRVWIEKYYIDNPRRLVFRSATGGNYFHVVVCRQWTLILKKVGLHDPVDPIHFHATRHFAASWMVANGLPLTEIAELLGHSKFDMTLQVYAHTISSPAQRRAALDGMSGRLLEGVALGAPL